TLPKYSIINSNFWGSHQKTAFSFLPQTLEYLNAGGRVSNASYLGAKLLKIYPSIEIKDGLLVAGKKYRGSFKKAALHFVEDFLKQDQLDLTSLKLVETVGLDPDTKAAIENLLKEQGIQPGEWLQAGAVITCHGGPGAFGISAIKK
ncbi:DegV family protein, partial [Hutsoniella sourekii]|uniref:DegV family protein n=1 Tax=Hutsoniella sourekii TaxID=87650 RepID=UPI001B7FB378